MFESMKHMAKDLPETNAGIVNSGNHETEPMYPFNLNITLDAEQVAALGLDCDDADCQPGNYLHIHGLARVEGVHKTGDGTSLNLVFTHMCAESEDSENADYDQEMSGAA